MSERTSIPAWKQTHRSLKQYKPSDMNWPEFMALVAEDFQDGDTATMIQENSNAGEFNADDVVSRVNQRLDDLEAELPRKVAEELHR